MTVAKKTAEKEAPKAEKVKLKGKYETGTGRRKTATARVRLFKNGNGSIMVNDMKAADYFGADYVAIMSQPLKLASQVKDVNLSIVVSGGGKKAQAYAIRHGIARALLEVDEELKPSLRAKGWLTRDARKKERKKPGLKKARRAPQWAKR